MVENEELARRLQTTIADEVIKSMGLSARKWARALLPPLISPATRRFAELFATFDQDARQLGMIEAARIFLPHLVRSCQQSGASSVPKAGPLLVAANHPGATDAVAIAASLPRHDLKIVITDVPFTRSLLAADDHLIYTPHEPVARANTVREILRHLANGGAVLIFPSGHLDPDPAFMAGAEEGLEDWSRSVALILRRAPQTWLLVTVVEGVLEPRFMSHPLVRLGPKGWEGQRLAEVLQIMQQMVFRTRYALSPRVTFGPPIAAATLRDQSPSAHLLKAIVDYARQVLALHRTQRDRVSLVPLSPAQGG